MIIGQCKEQCDATLVVQYKQLSVKWNVVKVNVNLFQINDFQLAENIF